MAKSLSYYTAEVSKSYDNSKNALQNQINAIEGNLATTQKQINENYAQQQNTLNNQKNQAASAASMQAAGSGGSFGGAANIANKKFYEQTFVPAQTQLNTNQSQALENAQTQANNNRLSLETQMANLNDTIAQQALARYYNVLDQERQEKLARQQIAAQNNAWNYANNAKQDKYGVSTDDGYQFRNNATGGAVKLGTFISQYGGNFNQKARDYINSMANNSDSNAIRINNILAYNPNKKLAANTGKNAKAVNYSFLSAADNAALNTLGLKLV